MADMDRWSGGRDKTWLLRLGAFLVAVVALYFLALMVKEWQGLSERHSLDITATGEGSVFIVPDIATLALTVRSQGVNLPNVQDENTANSNKIITFLKSKGVDEKDIKTSYYSVNPQYQYDNRVCQGGFCPPYGPAKIVSYEVMNTVTVKVRNLNSIGDILSGAVASGANEVSGPSFTVDDPAKAEADAKQIAITKARENANRLASQLGVKIVRISGYSESGGAMPLYAREAALDAKGGVAQAAPAPSIQPGQNEVRIMVSVTYEAR